MSGLSSVYPAPPHYYKAFTAENLKAFEKAKNIKDDEEQLLKLNSAPLENLSPPEPPASGGYSLFGSIWQVEDKLVPLSEAGIPQLYSEFDESPQSVQANHQSRVWELKKLLKSMLINFLELVKIMSLNPEKFPQKVEDIRIILINMHHLLNEYRPHQSRENLILLMEDQIQSVKQEIENIRKLNQEIQDKITNLATECVSLEEAKLSEPSRGSKSEEPESLPDSRPEQTDMRLWSLI